MTAEWFDLGQRLHASATGEVVARLAHTPAAAAARPVAVRATTTRGGLLVVATDPSGAAQSAYNRPALAMLGALGVSITAPAPATLVTDSPDTLPLLYRLARTAERDDADDDVAAHIAWWRDRADFPGGHAVVDLAASCRERWVTGQDPAAEDHLETWRSWLGVPDPSTAGLLTLHDALRAGPPLPVLSVLSEDTDYAWGSAQQAHADGRDWRWPDTTSRAAFGLRSRCDAADLYASGLLADPYYRCRAVHTGHVVTGRVERPAETDRRRSCRIVCDRLDVRLRPGTQVTGWTGTPYDQPDARYAGAVSAADVQAGSLVLTVSGLAGSLPDDGDPVTLHQAPVQPSRLRAASKAYRSLYAARRSWLTTGKTPTPTRRPVPLDVLVAGAEPD